MKVSVYNQKGEEVGTILLPKEVFDLKINSNLIHQVVISQLANRRRILAHTKDRSEVRGGGRKPWRQKGTGRARHGSRRSPLWTGGGITFGPTKERVFKKKINQKIRRKALLMTLSAKAKNNLIFIIDKFNLEKPKTKIMAEIIKKLKSKIKNFEKGSSLIILPKKEKKIILAARNLPEVDIIEARNLNCLDLLTFKYLIIPKEAVKIIKETFLKDNKQ